MLQIVNSKLYNILTINIISRCTADHILVSNYSIRNKTNIAIFDVNVLKNRMWHNIILHFALEKRVMDNGVSSLLFFFF